MHSVRRNIVRSGILILLTGLISGLQAQQQDSAALESPFQELSSGLFPKKRTPRLYKFNVSGFYRFFSTYTQNDLPYLLTEDGNYVVPKKNLFIGDDAQLPNLMLNVSGRPSEQFSWGFDLYAFQFLNGLIGLITRRSLSRFRARRRGVSRTR